MAGGSENPYVEQSIGGDDNASLDTDDSTEDTEENYEETTEETTISEDTSEVETTE